MMVMKDSPMMNSGLTHTAIIRSQLLTFLLRRGLLLLRRGIERKLRCVCLRVRYTLLDAGARDLGDGVHLHQTRVLRRWTLALVEDSIVFLAHELVVQLGVPLGPIGVIHTPWHTSSPPSEFSTVHSRIPEKFFYGADLHKHWF